MRVLEVVSAGDINGAVMHVRTLSQHLRQRGHEVFLACPKNAWIATQFPASHVIETPMSRWPLAESRRVATRIQELGVEVTHTHQSRAHSFGVMLRWLHGIPSVATAHNRRIQLHWALNSHVIGVSEITTTFHRRFNLVGRRQSTTIHNFVDVDQFSAGRDDGARQRIRSELGISSDRIIGVALGTIMKKKGLHNAIAALPDVLSKVPNFHLLVVGAPRPRDLPYYEQLLSQAADLGVASHLTWAGVRQDVTEVLSAADLLLSASLEENFPISVLEAMACQLPVVATNVGGVPECVVDQVTGRLVAPHHPQGLTDAIIEMGDSAKRKAFGAAARQRVTKRFSPESQMPLIEKVLRTAAAESSILRRKEIVSSVAIPSLRESRIR